MEPWLQQIVVPLAVAVLTSSGLWALVSKRADENDAERKMLVGLAHDRITHLGMAYAAAAAKAPVKPVSGGGDVTPAKEDPWLKGFDMERW